jgi:hypothetical protein
MQQAQQLESASKSSGLCDDWVRPLWVSGASFRPWRGVGEGTGNAAGTASQQVLLARLQSCDRVRVDTPAPPCFVCGTCAGLRHAEPYPVGTLTEA